MWKYIKKYLIFGVMASCLMICEVLMDLLQPGIMSRIVDEGVLGLNNGGVGNLQLIWKLGIQMTGVVLFGGFTGALCSLFSQLIGQNVGNAIRKDCFRKMMSFSFSQMDRFGAGSLITRVTNDITQVQTFVTVFFRSVVRMVMMVFGSTYFMFRLNREFGWIMSGAIPLIVACLVFCLKKGSPLFTKLQTHLDNINAIMQEDVSGMRIIKACVRETYEKMRFGKENNELIKTQLEVLVIFAFMNPIINALMYLTVALILLAGSYQAAAGATTPGDIMAAITYTTRMLNGILMMVMISQNISRGSASWKRLKEVLESEPELKDGKMGDAGQEWKCKNSELRKEKGELERGPMAHGEIEFRDVSFVYSDSSQMVLKHINLKIHSGETIAVMGATGCGKTTLVNLIPRFYDVTSGSLLVDGVDVREYHQKALREKIAIALQKSELFSESVAENISWGKTGKEENREHIAQAKEQQRNLVKQAAVIAQADDFISGMPNGYDTMVAERGTSLSGGQKQRLSIARAVIKDSEILIFDDATSALDLKTEANLYEALQESKPKITKIIVAQRIASVRRADRIVVLEDGQIVSVGTHEELMDSCKIYRDIYHSQIGEEGEEND